MNEDRIERKRCVCSQQRRDNGSEQATSQPTSKEDVINDLKRQRCEYVRHVNAGNVTFQPSIEFIDNMLAQLVSDYTPSKCCSCCKKLLNTLSKV